MRINFKGLAGLFLCGGLLFSAQAPAQTPAPLPVHAVRSIDPADTDFRDLAFLVREIGPARVVMLGEPTHGEGNVFEAKIRLIRFLQEKMGFTTLAFESGIYDLRVAQRELEAGKSAQEALGNSVFPIWTAMREFQGVLPLIGKGKLRVAGFDPQLTGEYSDDLVDDLENFLSREKGVNTPNYKYLEEVIGAMSELYAFLPNANLPDFEKEIAKASRLVEKAAAGPAGARRTEAVFWQQCLRSLLAQARNYALNKPGDKTEAEFKAKDSNPRDAQMADNMLWYLRQHPQEKVICWGALPHLANKAERLDNDEMKEFRPMGGILKAVLGPNQVYILGTLAGGGRHGAFGLNVKSVPAPAAGTLEAELLAQPADQAFVSLKHDAPGQMLTTYAFEYEPLAGPWSEVVDGFLWLRAVNPPHRDEPALAAGTASAEAEAAAVAPPGTMNPARRPQRVRAGQAGAASPTVRGQVLDRKTNAPVPYASVSVPAEGVGTVANGEGRFAVAVPAGSMLQISSVGYATANATAPADAALVTARLVPAATELQEVQVRGESLDPRKIMKKVLAALPQNYELNDYAAAVYTRRRISNFDTLSYEAEYVSQVFEPAGYHYFETEKDRAAAVPQEQHRIQELHEFKGKGRPALFRALFDKGQGLISADSDPVRTSPLFDDKTLPKFRLRLDSVVEHGGEVQYVISFAAKKANMRSTGTPLIGGYSGQLYVRQRDHAVLRYQALWQTDTMVHNAIINKWLPGPDQLRLHATLLSDHRTDHNVVYVRAANGRYHVRQSVAQAVRAGRVIGGQGYYRQISCEFYFTPLPAGTSPLPLTPKFRTKLEVGELPQLEHIDYHPAFWETYQRPTALDTTPAKP